MTPNQAKLDMIAKSHGFDVSYPAGDAIKVWIPWTKQLATGARISGVDGIRVATVRELKIALGY